MKKYQNIDRLKEIAELIDVFASKNSLSIKESELLVINYLKGEIKKGLLSKIQLRDSKRAINKSIIEQIKKIEEEVNLLRSNEKSYNRSIQNIKSETTSLENKSRLLVTEIKKLKNILYDTENKYSNRLKLKEKLEIDIFEYSNAILNIEKRLETLKSEKVELEKSRKELVAQIKKLENENDIAKYDNHLRKVRIKTSTDKGFKKLNLVLSAATVIAIILVLIYIYLIK